MIDKEEREKNTEFIEDLETEKTVTQDTQINPEPTNNETVASSTTDNTVAELEQVIEALQSEMSLLKQRLDEQTEKTDTFKGQYARLAADFDNFRKRNLKEKENIELQAKRNIINQILPVIDNFERARTQLKPANEGEMAIHKSYQGVYKNLVDNLKQLGVSPMRPENQPFDPNFHEAMLQEETDQYPEGTVIEELVRGYLLGDQVLRHAKVKVATAVQTMSTSLEDQSETEDEINSID